MTRSDERLRIAMIGQRGVPATFGGIERHVEEIGARLVERGHEVTVFCRDGYTQAPSDSHRGIRLRHLRTLPTKHFEAISHSAVSSVMTLGRGYDVVHYHAVGPGLVAPLPRYLTRAKVVLTVHGLDGQREKWGRVASTVLNTATWMSAHVPDATVVVSSDLQRHYRATYGSQTEWITNGVDRVTRRPSTDLLRQLDVAPRGYLLFVGRLVPEKAPDLLLRAFARVADPDARLIMAGGSSFTGDYQAELQELASHDARVIMPGYVYHDDLATLYANAGAFVQASNLEGLPLTVLEAASYELPLVVSDIPPHLEVVGSNGPGHRVFPRGDEASLTQALHRVLADLPAERRAARISSAKILARHDWDLVTDQTEALYLRLLGRPVRERPQRVRTPEYGMSTRVVLPDTEEAAHGLGLAVEPNLAD